MLPGDDRTLNAMELGYDLNVVFPWKFRGALLDFRGTSVGVPWEFSEAYCSPHGIAMGLGLWSDYLVDCQGTFMGLVLLWESSGSSVCFHEAPMGLPWGFNECPMRLPWKFHGTSIGSPWDYHGSSLGSVGIPWCFRGNSMGISSELYVDLPWAFRGPSVGNPWESVGLPWDIRGASTMGVRGTSMAVLPWKSHGACEKDQ